MKYEDEGPGGRRGGRRWRRTRPDRLVSSMQVRLKSDLSFLVNLKEISAQLRGAKYFNTLEARIGAGLAWAGIPALIFIQGCWRSGRPLSLLIIETGGGRRDSDCTACQDGACNEYENVLEHLIQNVYNSKLFNQERHDDMVK